MGTNHSLVIFNEIIYEEKIISHH